MVPGDHFNDPCQCKHHMGDAGVVQEMRMAFVSPAVFPPVLPKEGQPLLSGCQKNYESSSCTSSRMIEGRFPMDFYLVIDFLCGFVLANEV